MARRYPTDISPIAGLPGAEPANVAALTVLVNVGDDIALVGPCVPTLSKSWETLQATQVTQMLRAHRSSLPEGDVEVATLAPADVDEMLELVERTRPGPFRRRTIELGTYIGIREHGRLVATAGERTWIGDCREVSAVCTHRDGGGAGTRGRSLLG